MTDHAPHPAPAATLRCAGCLYDLAGLPDDGLCPECGTPIARSRPHGMNRHRAPALTRAMSMLIWAAVVRHGAPLLAMLAQIVIPRFAGATLVAVRRAIRQGAVGAA